MSHPLRQVGTLPAAALLVGIATLLGVVDASQLQYDRAFRGDPISWRHALIHGLPNWYAWALLVPAIVWVTRRTETARVRMEDGGRTGAALFAVAVHLVIASLVTLIQVALAATVTTLLEPGGGLEQQLAHLGPAFFKYIGLTYLGGIVTYGVVVAGWYGLEVYGRYRERERVARALDVQTSDLKALLAEARLSQLQAQLQPHFLFNTLHALSALILKGETTAAVRMNTRLSELLRRSLAASEAAEIPLSDELSLVSDYLEVQAVRYGDRLAFEVTAEEGTERCMVPGLVLQPLVENAIRHGIERRGSAGSVAVTAIRESDRLVLRVIDDGPGPSRNRPEGVGLRNTRARLDTLYGDAASLLLEQRPEGGAEARVSLPCRIATGD